MNLNNELLQIKAKVSPDSITKRCGGERCKVYQTNLPKQKVVINLEKEFDTRKDNSKRCDRLLFYKDKSTIYAVPIELKSGRGEESQVLDQLKKGLEFAATLVKDLNNVVYVPIVFTKRGIYWSSPKSQRQELEVKFNGKTRKVMQGRCGRTNNLANILSGLGYLDC